MTVENVITYVTSYIKRRLTSDSRSFEYFRKIYYYEIQGFPSVSPLWCRQPPTFYYRVIPVPRWGSNRVYKHDEKISSNEAVSNFEVILFINQQLPHPNINWSRFLAVSRLIPKRDQIFLIDCFIRLNVWREKVYEILWLSIFKG